MAAKKTGKRSVNKSEFVRNLPASMSAREVVAKAKEAGIDIGEKHVHAIRSLARRNVGSAAAAAPRRRGRPPRAAAAAVVVNGGATNNGSVERQLAEMVLDHGMRRIESALATIRDRLKRSLA
jgi:hypothetical protein